jgi:hypothetical protein
LPVDDRHQAIGSEAPKIGIPDAREARRRNPGLGLHFAHAHALAVERLDDLGRQDRLELLHTRVLLFKIAANISASADNFNRFLFSSQHLLQSLQSVLYQIITKPIRGPAGHRRSCPRRKCF